MPNITEWFRDLEVWQVLLGGLGAAVLLHFVLLRLIAALTRRTATALDDKVIAAVRTPLFVSLLLIALAVVTARIEWTREVAGETQRVLLGDHVLYRLVVRLLATIAVLLWAKALARVADAVLTVLAARVDDFRWIEARSLPLYELVAKLLLIGGAIYALLMVWDIDVTAWLASAGILGLAIGFAAKDTLANLFAGIFIIADAPYKLGDFIIIDSGERGVVTDIGLRSTRILTRDDIEVTIPNSVMANAKIVNETSGPHRKRRVRVDVGVAYDSDLDRVREVLVEVAGDCDLVVDDPHPRVRYRGFGDSAIELQLLAYIREPVLKGRAVDTLIAAVHKRFLAEGIEIPFPQRVVHMTPTAPASG